MERDINKSCCFTGHRPDKCIGTEETIRSRLLKTIKESIAEGYDTFVTGMALGVDTWAAEEVIKLKAEHKELKLVCAVPFKGMEKKRTTEQQAIFNGILNMADEVVYITPRYQRWSFHARDEWMVDNASKVIAVFNGTHGGTEYTINYAKRKGRTIAIIDDSE